MNKPWIFYDAECGICRTATRVLRLLLGSNALVVEPLQTNLARRLFNLEFGARPSEMKAITADRTKLGGIDSLLYLAGLVWWLKPLAWAGRVKGTYNLMKTAYHWLAANRYCFGGTCRFRETV